ncbi:hypothetical protein [Nocardioides sp. KR10-350]
MPSLTQQDIDELGGRISILVPQKGDQVRLGELLERLAEGSR